MKARIVKILKWVGIAFFVFVTGFLILQRVEFFENAMLNMSFRYNDTSTLEKFSNQLISPEIKYTYYKNIKVRYMQLVTNPTLPYVIFIHGAPGSSADYLEYFKDDTLIAKANLISVDRIGYGYSEYGTFETSLKAQAAAIAKVIEESCTHNNIIIVGHSYGGPIALRLAVDLDRIFKGILLLAPAIDPKNEKEVKIASLGINPWTRWIATPALQVASAEKTTHISELKKLEGYLQKINTPVCHIHGTKDSLVPYENVEFSKRMLDPELLEIITLKNVDHFLPWSHHDLVVDKILELCKAEEITKGIAQF